MIDDLPASLPGGVWDHTYADNIVVVCRTEPECADVEESLNRYFADHPAGPFSLSVEHNNIDDGFDHLGYQYLRCGDDVHLTPSDYNLGKMMRRIELACKSACANDDPTEFSRAVDREIALARLAHPSFKNDFRLKAMAFREDGDW